jgi:hypothetical protein
MKGDGKYANAKETSMKKILFGTLAAAALAGSISAASAQIRYYGADEYGYPSSAYGASSQPPFGYSDSVYAAPYGGWLTPQDPYSSTSMGYDRNVADPDNVGGG